MNDEIETIFRNNEPFVIKYDGHESSARKLIIETKIKSAKELAIMTNSELAQIINTKSERTICLFRKTK